MLSTRPVACDQETAQAPAPAKFLELALARCNACAQSRGGSDRRDAICWI